VSAVEEYRSLIMPGNLRPKDMADAAIAELEAENAQLRLHWQREAKNASRLDAALEQAEAELAALRADWVELRSQVVAYEKSGIDLYQRENGKAFRKMMDRVLARKDGES
jgi:predicted nuclease with TOPRIM domain